MAFREATRFKPDIVIITLGTNDTKPKFWVHKAEFTSDYLSLVDHFRKLESKPRILLCYPVPMYPNPEKEENTARNRAIKEEILPIIDKVAEETAAQVVDLHFALSNKPESFPDHVHPDADGARLIAETIKAAIVDSKPKESSGDE
jgi:lysophospholipase L1-like esterase